MKKHNQYGFSALELILIIVAIVVIAGAGYTVWHLQSNKPSSSTATTSNANGSTTKQYQQDGLSFSYTYPSNLKAAAGDGTVTLTSADFDEDTTGAPKVLKGESITIEGETSDGIDQEGMARHLTIDNYITENFTSSTERTSVAKTSKTATINGIKTLQFDFDNTRQTVFFMGDGKRVVVKLTYPTGSQVSDHDKVYNQIVSSIKP